MTRLCFLSLLLTLAACRNQESAADPELIKAALTGYFDGIRTQDRQKMIAATTDDFLLYEDGKVWNNDSVFREMDKHKFSVTYTFSDLNISVNRTLAHVSYHAKADFVFDDTVSQSLHFIESASFKKKGDRWAMNFLHVTSQQPRYDTIHYAPEYYAERVAQFKAEPVQKNGIIFLGNSIIEYANWRKLLGDSSVVNRGIAADNTFGVLRRLDDVVARKPRKLFIEIGINDVAQSIPADIIVENILAIVKRVHAESPGTRFFVISLLPTNDDVKNEYPDAFNKNHISESINNKLRRLAIDKAFTYVDVNKRIRDELGKLNRALASPDGLHLNEEGYRAFVKQLKADKGI
ncbi:MAG TPA: GDSL-type esterase/lipase family protein [Cyclobacteriaceae bacterium]|nr:GDSL-type esterase/lipase family protein [Cyclobacteriaceae bacterium]